MLKTSERVDKIIDAARVALREIRRLAVDLPNGQTLEIVEANEARLNFLIQSLQTEAAQLRSRFRD
jgi:hypothetical protein